MTATESTETKEAPEWTTPPSVPATVQAEVIPPEQDAPVPAIQSPVSEIAPVSFQSTGKLVLSPDEEKALQAPFQVDEFEIKPTRQGEVYLSHQVLAARMNKVLGIGQWSMAAAWVDREGRAQFKMENDNICMAYDFFVRGHRTSQPIGGMRYQQNNERMDYSDALEGVRSSAVKRGAKHLGVGLECWNKPFCEAFRAEHAIRVWVKPEYGRNRGKKTVLWRLANGPALEDEEGPYDKMKQPRPAQQERSSQQAEPQSKPAPPMQENGGAIIRGVTGKVEYMQVGDQELWRITDEADGKTYFTDAKPIGTKLTAMRERFPVDLMHEREETPDYGFRILDVQMGA